MKRKAVAFLFVLLSLLLVTSGCYYWSAQDEMKNAERLISELKGAGGANRVPYEYTSAEKFLEVSRMEFAEYDYLHARDLAARSKAAAQAGLAEVKKK